MACPKCHQDIPPTPVKFTWWGGLLGPKMLSHAECPACRTRYNSKTGQLNTNAIIVYSLVIGAIAALLMYYVITQLGHHHRY